MSQYFKSLSPDSEFEHALVTCKRRNQRSAELTQGVVRISEIDVPYLRSEIDLLTSTLRVMSRLRQVVFEEQPSIIHLHAAHELSIFTVKIARELNIPLIYHFHGGVDRQLMSALKPVLPFLKNVLAVSQEVRQSLLPYLSSNAEVRVIVNGVEDLLGTPVQVDRNPNYTLLIAGRIEYEKGFDVAIRALSLILEEFPSVRLLVIGSGSRYESLKKLGKQLGVSSQIDFLGNLKNCQVVEKIQQSDIVLVPSRAEEGFGIVAIEAALREVLVIASDVGGLRYTVEDKKSGFLVPAENAIALAQKVKEVLRNLNSFDEMRIYSRLRALNLFSIENFRSNLEGYYGRLLNGEKS